MNSSKITLKKLLYEHNTEANALLRASYSELETAITRYLNFIENSPLIKDFIEDAVANHTPEGIDCRQDASNAVEAMQEALAEEKPKASIVKTIMGALKDFNGCVAFANNVAALATFILINYPGLLN